jgi:hypothetical protein
MKEHAQLVDFESNSDMSNRVDQYLSNIAPRDAASPSLLRLGKLFVLANMYLVEDLTKYSLCCLYNHLVSKKAYLECTSELLHLLRYTHATDGAQAEACEEGISLWELVAMYVEKHSDRLRHLNGFEVYLASAVKFKD